MLPASHEADSVVRRAVFDSLLSLGAVTPGQLVISTKGDIEGVTGGTNAMTILEVTPSDQTAA